MGKELPLRVIVVPPRRRSPAPPPGPGIERRRPRGYLEWKTLRRWDRLPPWEPLIAGYLLREARERARLSQQSLATKLGCSQQAVAQAERPDSNPTLRFIASWARAVGEKIDISFLPQAAKSSRR